MQIDLHALNLQSKWPKLLKLEQDRHNFKRRLEKASAQVSTARGHVPRARAADIEEASAAVRQGRRPPEPTREPAAKRDLEHAERERDILAGVLQRVEEEYGGFMARYQRELFRDVLGARHAVALELAERARACLANYARWADLAHVVKGLTPAEPVVEGAPAQRLTQSFIGLHTAQRGVNRGDVEATLQHLIDSRPRGGRRRCRRVRVRDRGWGGE